MEELHLGTIFGYGYQPFRMDTPEHAEKTFERFYSRIFTVKEAYITPKRFHDWHHAGLMPFDIPQGKKNFLTLTEFIWVKMIDKLRLFGFSIENILHIKEYLFQELYPFAELYDAETGELNEEHLAIFHEALSQSETDSVFLQQLKEELESARPFEVLQNQRYVVLDTLLLHLLSSSDEIGLEVFPTGSFKLWQASSGDPRSTISHAFVSISDELMVFRTSELLEKKIKKMDLLSPEEWQVIAAIRDKRIKEVTIKFIEKNQERRMDLITTREGHFDEETASKIVELLKLGDYTELVMKTSSGGRIYTERSKRRRI